MKKDDQRDIRKHRNDVFRLYQLITLDTRVRTPDSIKHDLNLFLTQITGDASLDLSGLKPWNISLEEIVTNLSAIYGLQVSAI